MVAKIGVDTAENELFQVVGTSIGKVVTRGGGSSRARTPRPCVEQRSAAEFGESFKNWALKRESQSMPGTVVQLT